MKIVLIILLSILSLSIQAVEKGGMYVTKEAMIAIDFYEFVEMDSLPAMRIKPYLWFSDRPVYEYNLEKKIEACRAPIGTPCNSKPANPQPAWAGRPVYPIVVIDKTDCYEQTTVCGIKCAGYAYCTMIEETEGE